MRIRSLIGLLAAITTPAVVAIAPAHAEPDAKSYYVAPGGTGPACSFRVPCDLLTARAKVRQVLAEGMARDIRVVLADGTYRTPLELGPDDSGRGEHTVTWTAATGANAVFDGGTAITGWQPTADGQWVASAPAGVTPRQLFVDGVRAIRARGEECPASVCDATKTGMTGAVATGIASWARPTDAEAVIRVRWRNYHCRVASVADDLITFAQPCWQNSASGTNRTGPAWDTTTVDSSRYSKVSYFENAIELLDTPGEFVWNSTDRTVTYLPRPGVDLRTAAVVTPKTETLLTLDGARNVTIDRLGFEYAAYQQPNTAEGYAGTQAGLTLTGASGPVDHAGRYYTKPAAAVVVRAGRGVTLTGLRFEHLGGAGVVLEAGTQDTTLTRSTFTDLSSGAVYIGDTEPNPAPELTGKRNTISYNTIRRIGVEYTDAVGIWAGYEAELTVDHNTLEQLPYSGISVGWGWNQPEARNPVSRDNAITNNRIVDAMMTEYDQHDGGGIYTQGPQPGTVVSGNYINRSAFGNTERDGNGVYLDEQSSYITVERNVITRIGYKWVSNWAGYGIENLATGNWTDTEAPALSGRGSRMVDNHTGLEQLPAEALQVAAAAGAAGGPVEQLLPDLARHGVASQSSTSGTARAALALDGSTTSDTRTLTEAGAWWQVDLGAATHISTVEIWNDASMRLADFDVLVGNTPDLQDARRVHVDGRALRPSLVTIGSTGRYIRIQRTGTGTVAVSEVKAHP